MRRVILERPFTAGMVTDQPAHLIGPQHSSFAQDGVSTSGLFAQRKGWVYDGALAVVADRLVAVRRDKFILADVTRTIVGDDDGDLFIHNSAAVGTQIFDGAVSYLPRCMYRDEQIWCAQDGVSPLRRYGGAGVVPAITDASGLYVSSGSGYTNVIFATAPESGLYLRDTGIPLLWFRLLSATTATATVEHMLATSAAVSGTISLSLTGMAWPGVSVYQTGVTAFSGGVLTGHGTKWVDEAAVTTDDAIMLDLDNGRYEVAAQIDATPANTDLGNTHLSGAVATTTTYRILRRCPFKDAAVHKGSLWGAGVAQYPNRVYFGPPDWNLSTYPGDVGRGYPAPATSSTVSNADELLLEFVDVPSVTDGDHIIAILESPNPLLVLKRNSVYGVFGTYPSFSVDMIVDGIGCIDIRSAHSYDEGQFWAGESGIFWYSGGRITDLTAGRINREWRALARDFGYTPDDFCSLWLASGHLWVHMRTQYGAVSRTFLCDLRDGSWQSEITNIAPRYGYTARIPGEREKALIVQDSHQGRVIDVAPCLNGLGRAKDGDGVAPRLQARTSSALGRANGIEGMTRLADLDIHANIYDDAAAATRVDASLISSYLTVDDGGGEGSRETTKALTSLVSNRIDRVKRYPSRANRRGRLHQVSLDAVATGTDNAFTKVEIAQIVASFRDGRGRA